MNAAQLIDEAYKCSHYAADLTEQIYRQKNSTPEDHKENITILLEQARGLNAAVQQLENIARKHPIAKDGP